MLISISPLTLNMRSSISTIPISKFQPTHPADDDYAGSTRDNTV